MEMGEPSPKSHWWVIGPWPAVVLVKAVVWPSQSGELDVNPAVGAPYTVTEALAELDPAALVAVRITVKVPAEA